jgi:hypothetical protein
MKKILIIGSLIVFSGCVSVKKDIALKTYVSGLLYEEEKENIKAIKEFEESIRKGEKDPYIYLKIGKEI